METQERKHQVRIHIDQKAYESPTPTVGEALYKLGKVAPGFELYREVHGNREDQPIPNGPETIHLKEDEHFHSGPVQNRDITVYVNTRPKVVKTSHLTYDEVVALAYNPVPQGPNVLFTISYDHGPRENPEGSLLKGGVVKIQNGMTFNVKQTDRS